MSIPNGILGRVVCMAVQFDDKPNGGTEEVRPHVGDLVLLPKI